MASFASRQFFMDENGNAVMELTLNEATPQPTVLGIRVRRVDWTGYFNVSIPLGQTLTSGAGSGDTFGSSAKARNSSRLALIPTASLPSAFFRMQMQLSRRARTTRFAFGICNPRSCSLHCRKATKLLVSPARPMAHGWLSRLGLRSQLRWFRDMRRHCSSGIWQPGSPLSLSSQIMFGFGPTVSSFLQTAPFWPSAALSPESIYGVFKKRTKSPFFHRSLRGLGP